MLSSCSQYVTETEIDPTPEVRNISNVDAITQNTVSVHSIYGDSRSDGFGVDTGTDEFLQSPISRARQPVINTHYPIGVYNENSILSYPAMRGSPLIGENGYLPPYTLSIYRTIYPWADDGDVIDALYRQINEKGIFIGNLGDTIVAYLLTEESVIISDDELVEKLSVVTEVYAFSKETESINYRLVAMNLNADRTYLHWMCWDYYVQVWDDYHIWAQPLCECVSYRFSQARFISLDDTFEILLLSGWSSPPHGTGHAVACTGFYFEDELWTPVDWREVFDEVGNAENLIIYADGVGMIVYPEWLMITNGGAWYAFEVDEDGSIWADYSAYSGHLGNENLPEKELLFMIR